MKDAQPLEDDKLSDDLDEESSKPITRGARKRATNVEYDNADEDDDAYFTRLAEGERGWGDKAASTLGREHQMKQARKWRFEALHSTSFNLSLAVKKVNNMRLRNLVMQLRKICSHPYLFDWPLDENKQLTLDDQLVNASGKMLMLNRLLDELFKRKHKVLLFRLVFHSVMESY